MCPEIIVTTLWVRTYTSGIGGVCPESFAAMLASHPHPPSNASEKPEDRSNEQRTGGRVRCFVKAAARCCFQANTMHQRQQKRATNHETPLKMNNHLCFFFSPTSRFRSNFFGLFFGIYSSNSWYSSSIREQLRKWTLVCVWYDTINIKIQQQQAVHTRIYLCTWHSLVPESIPTWYIISFTKYIIPRLPCTQG